MMAYQNYNPNPAKSRVGDCTVRALAKALGMEWDEAYAALCAEGFRQKDMPSADAVWGAVLRQSGFHRRGIPDTCPECYTVAEFARDHPDGVFVVGTGGHVLTIADGGNYYDTWDSGDESPLFYYEKK